MTTDGDRKQANVPALAPGQIVAGRYRVDRVLGEGGMGMVVAAVHIQLKTRVALKVLKREAAMYSDAAARFLREARAAANLKSEHIASVTDFGTLEDGSPFLVMEYLEGQDLSDVLEQRASLPVSTAIDYVLEACEALAKAHVLGIVHRDIKPANLFLTRGDHGGACIKVLDFGISKVAANGALGSETQQVETGIACGSPHYMSPEQIRAVLDMDGRTDIWALGVTLFQLITNDLPFKGASIQQISASILEQPAPSIRTYRADLPQALDEVIQRSLAKDRAHRWPNVAEFAWAIAPYGSKRAQTSIERIGAIMPNTIPMRAIGDTTQVMPVPAVHGPRAYGAAGTTALPTLPLAGVRAAPAQMAPVNAGVTNDPTRPLQRALAPALPATTETRPRWPLLVAIGALGIVGAVAGIGSIWYLQSNDKPAASASAAPSAPPVAASTAMPEPLASVAAEAHRPTLRIEVPGRLLANRPIRFSIGTTERLYVALLAVDESGAASLLLPNKRNALPMASPDAPLYFPSADEERAGLTPTASLPPGKSSTKEKFVCLGFADEAQYKRWVAGTRRASAILNAQQVVEFVEGAERDGAIVQERAYEIVR